MARMDELLICRDIGHDWDESFRKVRDAGWGKHRVLRCGNCGSERIELINMNGTIDSRHYEYAEDYHKVSSLSKNEARQERLARMNRKSKTRRLQVV